MCCYCVATIYFQAGNTAVKLTLHPEIEALLVEQRAAARAVLEQHEAKVPGERKYKRLYIYDSSDEEETGEGTTADEACGAAVGGASGNAVQGACPTSHN
jgi:hypothetical protein